MKKAAATYTGRSSENVLLNQINDAADSAVSYLLEIQNKNGHWYDYQLPVGISDEWITGYVGRSLNEWIPEHHSLNKAAQALLENRAYEKGWGYNKNTGPDADSTANVMLFLRSLNLTIPTADQEFLLAHQQADGGFSTYMDNNGWSISHPDVTPMVFLALSDPAKRLCASRVKGYLMRHCVDNHLWPAYWWRNCFYSCFQNQKLINHLFDDGLIEEYDASPDTVQLGHDQPLRIDSPFDLAWLCGMYWLSANKQETSPNAYLIAQSLTSELINNQSTEGFFPGSHSLRVTDPTTTDLNLKVEPQGKYYCDHHHTITTASALQILALAKTTIALSE